MVTWSKRVPLHRFIVRVLLVWCCGYPRPCRGGKVLVLHPMFAPSHVLALRTLHGALLDRGHTVVVVRLDPNVPEVHRANLTEVVLEVDNSDGRIPLMTHHKTARFEMPKDTWQNGIKFNFMPLEGYLTVVAYCHALLGDTNLVRSLREERFDVVLVDLIYNECSMALAHHIGVPAIGYWAFSFVGYEPMYTAAYNPPSTVPYIFSGVTGHMSFRDRLWNYFLHLYSTVLLEVLFIVTQATISQHLPGTPPPATLLSNLSGALINSHPALDHPRQLPPAFLEIGGFHIKPAKPLPKHLVEFMASGGVSGVILFSLGCTFNTNYMPPDIVRTFINVFARLPQKVLVRVTGSLPRLPRNVMAVDWLPQPDVLAHPNTVLFITHCGMHGALEALHAAVPMVGIPIFADQMDVLLRLREKGVVVGVSKQATEDELHAAIMEALNNDTYRANAASLSRVLKHRVRDPLQSAVWLLEHVMLTKGADHLKPRTQHLNRLQFLGIDVVVFYVSMAVIILYCTCRFVYNADRYIPYSRKS